MDDETIRKLAYELAAYPPNKLDMRQVIDSFNALADWINATVIPTVKEISDKMKDAGFYIDDNSKLACDFKKGSTAYLMYWKRNNGI